MNVSLGTESPDRNSLETLQTYRQEDQVIKREIDPDQMTI